MSTNQQKQLPGISREAEEAHLQEILTIVKANLQKYGGEVSAMRGSIDEMLAHFHDDNPELINELDNTYTMYNFLNATLIRNERALKKPYFGRIDFHDESQNTQEAFYIGKAGISKDATHPVVIDWRAPIANAYYENGLGKCSYLSPEGNPIPIDLQLKRTYEIKDGKLENYFDTDVIANDEILTKYLSQNKQAVLNEIVATIQKEQNDIIRKIPYHNCLVQGVAGSGKTTVAMHRISYILYNYAERFRPEDFYIVGSNRMLLNYITGVLPDLDVYGVRQMTMEQLFIRLLYEDWDDKKYAVKSMDMTGRQGTNKGTLSWFEELKAFCDKLERDTISVESIYLNPQQFVEGFEDGKTGVHDRTGGKPANPKDSILLVDGNSVENYLRENPGISVQSKINMLNERLRIKIKDEFLRKNVQYTEAERKAILKFYRGKYGGTTWKKSIFSLYEEFLREQQNKGYDLSVPETAFDVYDLAALAYLYKRVKETEVISEAHHIVIDEAQDFGMMAYSVLKFCIKDCTYTIMGDVSQNIHFGHGLNDWEELKQLYLKDSRASFCVLKKSYRNTVEISDFAAKILHHGNFAVYPIEPIIRHGNAPRVLPMENQEQLLKQAAEICREWQGKGLETIAVICRNYEAAQKTARELGQWIEVLETDLERTEFGSGIMVLPVEYTKGLEFDAVLLLDPTREEYPVDDGHAKLLYVAATRALHELSVLHTGNLTGLIADPVPEKTVKVIEDVVAENEKPVRKVRRTVESQREIQGRKADVKYVAKDAALPNEVVSELSESADIANKTVAEQPKRADISNKSVVEHPKSVFSQTKTPAAPSKAAAARLRRVSSQNQDIKHATNVVETTSEKMKFAFGDMPATQLLKPLGHAKTNQTVRWVTKKTDGIYLQSAYGLLRISPINSNVIRVTFGKGSQLPDGVHPIIGEQKPFGKWKYKDSPKILEMITEQIYLKVDKTTGAVSFMTRKKQPLMAERSVEAKLFEQPLQGPPRTRFYWEIPKNELLSAVNHGIKTMLSLKGTARYITPKNHTERLPLVLSNKGYGLMVAAGTPVFCCNLPGNGPQICIENSTVLDYYFIMGKDAEEIYAFYKELCGIS